MKDASRPEPAVRDRQLSGGLFRAPQQAVPERVAVADRTKGAHDDGPGEQSYSDPKAETAAPHPDDYRNSKTQQGAAGTTDDDCAAVGLRLWVDSGLDAHRFRSRDSTNDNIGPDAASRPMSSPSR